MRLAFIDIVYGYDAARPDRDEPLGGTTSAICFLARALEEAGHEAVLFNTIPARSVVLGIEARPLSDLAQDCVNEAWDAMIFCGRWHPPIVEAIKSLTNAPLIAWMHQHLFDDELIQPLAFFDGVVFVSEWQQRTNEAWCRKHWVQTVIRNAMNPLLAQPRPPMTAAMIENSVNHLVFVGDFVRGAMHLLAVFNALRKQTPEPFKISVFCAPPITNEQEVARAWFEALRAYPEVVHVGKVGQPRLIEVLRSATILVSPNPWPETSCIAMIEALAAPLFVVTTNRAALPETGSGFPYHVAIAHADHPSLFAQPLDHEEFARAIATVMMVRQERPSAAVRHLEAQRRFFLEHYQWHQRVSPWIDMIRRLQ